MKIECSLEEYTRLIRSCGFCYASEDCDTYCPFSEEGCCGIEVREDINIQVKC